jgi:hypothetical protein
MRLSPARSMARRAAPPSTATRRSWPELAPGKHGSEGWSEGGASNRPPTCAQADRYSNSAVPQQQNARNDGEFGAAATSHADKQGRTMSDDTMLLSSTPRVNTKPAFCWRRKLATGLSRLRPPLECSGLVFAAWVWLGLEDDSYVRARGVRVSRR